MAREPRHHSSEIRMRTVEISNCGWRNSKTLPDVMVGQTSQSQRRRLPYSAGGKQHLIVRFKSCSQGRKGACKSTQEHGPTTVIIAPHRLSPQILFSLGVSLSQAGNSQERNHVQLELHQIANGSAVGTGNEQAECMIGKFQRCQIGSPEVEDAVTSTKS